MKKVVIDFEEYSPKSGFGVKGVWESDAAIKVEYDAGYPAIVISGNKKGLLSLGKVLIQLAQPEVPEDVHLHCDAGNLTTEDSEHMIIQINPKLNPPLSHL